MKLKVGLIGLGPTWQSRHRPALAALSNRYSVRAVCDPVAHRADQVAAELGARPIDGFRALAAAEDIEAILMLSGRWFGALPIHAACEFGKAIYCGASVELAEREACSLRERVRRSGIAFMAEFPFRLAPATIRLKELIATRLGAPRMLFCNERHAAPTHGGGLDEAPASHSRRLIEMVDWCRYIADGEPTTVQCATHSTPGGIEPHDYSLVTVEFETSNPAAPPVLAQIACGSYVPTGWSEAAAFRRPADLQVACERGIAFVDLPGTVTWFDEAGQHTEHVQDERPLGERLLMAFHRSVSSLVLRSTSLEDAYCALQVVLAAQRSATDGRRVVCGPDDSE
ncbi:Inositol 2-dehydrogenase/D-chiro-inositol 3-dehydrogenase [Botrimarina colliarenosi]|uniref:Inositol 2-dehydrogenase/D-chiro-inositol 3-dehydrogenase n=1 Tax=Botrimarina colliarenosi TaxID=2528001 RepID=A0A5C6AFT5_9BACT|nr:Gfo/Idh/MocA family oxidoreductase [Botrimarina colliarenosi]TWT98055.1 Inositol 2-dehydrogenase/D-chiro-inositol 3-dehydrogenase [Botrimarina colliarenosi]